MKTIAYIVIAIVMVFTNSASAMTEHEVAEYISEHVEGANHDDARFCADSWQNGGVYKAKMSHSTLVCSKHYINETWDR